MLERDAAKRWSQTDELLASLLELTHGVYTALLGIGGVKGRDLPKPLKVRRPTDTAELAPPATRAERYARLNPRR